jgi:dynein heavy chain 1
MRYYYNEAEDNPLERLTVCIANSRFTYGYEYLGPVDRLVQTSLTSRCYSALSQALHYNMGGSPFGPAGTGKTESVKALGGNLGQLVLVFCCDEQFDYNSISRILIGLCKVGAWACFDEFNRLEERILSSVSQQIQIIQQGLKADKSIVLLGKSLKVNRCTSKIVDINW